MTDFFADLESELRQAHRRDTARPGRVTRPSIRPVLAAAAAIAAVVAVAAIVAIAPWGRDTERSATPPPPPPPTRGCTIYEPPVLNATIPAEILDRFELFRRGQSAPSVPTDGLFTRASRLYNRAVLVRAGHDHGPGPILGIAIPADVAPEPSEPRRDDCSPPRGHALPGVCLATETPDQGMVGGCFTMADVEDADAWIPIGKRGVLGIAPDRARRVIFDTGQPNGPDSLTVADNAFGGARLYLYPAKGPYDAETRFEP